jgi:hypothetical protein
MARRVSSRGSSTYLYGWFACVAALIIYMTGGFETARVRSWFTSHYCAGGSTELLIHPQPLIPPSTSGAGQESLEGAVWLDAHGVLKSAVGYGDVGLEGNLGFEGRCVRFEL